MTKFMAFLVKNSWFFLQNHGIFLKIHVWNFVLDILQPSNNTRPLTKTKRIPEIAYILLRVSSKFQDWRHIHNTRLPYPRPPQTMMIPSLASKLRSIFRGLRVSYSKIDLFKADTYPSSPMRIPSGTSKLRNTPPPPQTMRVPSLASKLRPISKGL